MDLVSCNISENKSTWILDHSGGPHQCLSWESTSNVTLYILPKNSKFDQIKKSTTDACQLILLSTTDVQGNDGKTIQIIMDAAQANFTKNVCS